MESKSSKGQSKRRSAGTVSPSKTPKSKNTVTSPPSGPRRRSARLRGNEESTPTFVATPNSGKKEKASVGRKRALKDAIEDKE